MIRVKRLKELLAQVPDSAKAFALQEYLDGSICGIQIRAQGFKESHLRFDARRGKSYYTKPKGRSWWISMFEDRSEESDESCHTGFKKKGKR